MVIAAIRAIFALKCFLYSFFSKYKMARTILLPRLDEIEFNYQIKLEMHGMEQKNIDINVENNTFTIRGKNDSKKKEEAVIII